MNDQIIIIYQFLLGICIGGYYVMILIALFNSAFDSKKQFLLSLIPFALIVIVMYSKYKELEDDSD